MKDSNKKQRSPKSDYKYLAEKYNLTLQDIKKLGVIWSGIKSRCGKKSGYEDVKCEWETLEQYLVFVTFEIDQGRDFRLMERASTARLFDRGPYSNDNCYICPASQNTKERNQVPVIIFESTNKTKPITFVRGLKAFWRMNKDKVKLSLPSLYRKVDTNEWIPIYDEQSGSLKGYIKINRI
ncbi:hypothetical protein [Vibrio cholerae]|uniref:hypothetical protein n=1 Tax=Vibrio cholerae TaxID=666 RepID=UPI0011D5B28F|nr:hypothetical protein [Vibrio cholerae]TXX48342.1 hypothetical protein FXF14_11020 [Vibrio cholerae]